MKFERRYIARDDNNHSLIVSEDMLMNSKQLKELGSLLINHNFNVNLDDLELIDNDEVFILSTGQWEIIFRECICTCKPGDITNNLKCMVHGVVCMKCGELGGFKDFHQCPYAMEIEDDDSDVCNCCDDCVEACQNGI